MVRPRLAILVDLAALVEEQLGLLDILPPHSILHPTSHNKASCHIDVCGGKHQGTVLCAHQPPCKCHWIHARLLAAAMTAFREHSTMSGGVHLQGGPLEPVKRIDI